MDNRKLLALSQALQGKSAAEVETILGQKHLDPQERLAVKVQIAAAAKGRTVHARGLATDGAEYRPHLDPHTMGTMDRLLRRIGVDATRQYTEAELTELLQQTDLDAESRIAVRLECQARGLTLFPREVYRLLDTLVIDRPISRSDLDERLDLHGIDKATLRTAIRTALQERGLLAQAHGARTLRASAARHPTPLLDRRTGQAITLKSRPE